MIKCPQCNIEQHNFVTCEICGYKFESSDINQHIKLKDKKKYILLATPFVALAIGLIWHLQVRDTEHTRIEIAKKRESAQSNSYTPAQTQTHLDLQNKHDTELANQAQTARETSKRQAEAAYYFQEAQKISASLGECTNNASLPSDRSNFKDYTDQALLFAAKVGEQKRCIANKKFQAEQLQAMGQSILGIPTSSSSNAGQNRRELEEVQAKMDELRWQSEQQDMELSRIKTDMLFNK